MGPGPQPADRGQIGPYRVIRRLGAGGMGEVYLCHSAGGQKVAVKVIRRELADDPQFRARFRREVAAARKVNGLYTAHVVDADTGASEPWLATAFLDAPSLANEVRERGPMSPVAVARLAAALAEGLGKIHVVGLVHRDLKPSNVLLASDGPRIIDFGIAWSAEAVTLTPENGTVGSPGYMAPEQADPDLGKAVGPRSDVFSLGAVLCFAATGRSPWGNGSTATLIYRAVHSKPNLGLLPAEIRPLVAQCLAKDPAERPTPEEILAKLGDEELLAEDKVRETAPDTLLLSAPVIVEDEDLPADRSYMAVPRPAPVPRPLREPGLDLVSAIVVPEPAAMPELDAGPEPEPDREPVPAAAAASRPPPMRQPLLAPPPQPAGSRGVSSVRVPARERRVRPRNPDYVGPNTPTDVKIVVGGLIVVSIIAAIITGVLLNNIFIAAIEFIVLFLALSVFLWISRL